RYFVTPAVEACARCAVPNASFTYTSAYDASFCASVGSFFSSPGSNRTFSSIDTPPGARAATVASADGPTTSFAHATDTPRISLKRFATGASPRSSTTFPSGRPRCETSMILALCSTRYSIVGSAARMRVSSRILPFSSGTLKSTRTSTRLPSTSMSRTVFFFIGASSRRPLGAWANARNASLDRASANRRSCYDHRRNHTRGSMDDKKFHFSPCPTRANEIAWQEWSSGAFEKAQREDKPVLLDISAVWCHWCHVMDETSYSDPEIISLINDRFVALRVDNDQRPDVNARYNMGGWPTPAFLTPEGEVMAGMTYIPPEQMHDVLNQVSTYYKDNKETIQRKISEIAENRARNEASEEAAGDALSDQVLRDALHSAADAYDPVYGGFGNEPKFPHTDAIDLLL